MIKILLVFFVSVLSLETIAQDFRPIPEIGSGFKAGKVVEGQKFMAVTANPHATRAAYEILERGGTVVDAAIAAQLVWGLLSHNHRDSAVALLP